MTSQQYFCLHYPFYQMGKLRPREGPGQAQGHCGHTILALGPRSLGPPRSAIVVVAPQTSPGLGLSPAAPPERQGRGGSQPCSRSCRQWELLLRRTDVSPNGKCTCFSLVWEEVGAEREMPAGWAERTVATPEVFK